MPVALPLVLVVIEDGDELAVISEILRGEGYGVATARDGAEALQKLREDPRPALVLLEQVLREVHGQEVLRAMRAEPALASIPIVWISDGPKPPPAAVAGWLRKPFDLDDLLASLQGACSTPR